MKVLVDLLKPGWYYLDLSVLEVGWKLCISPEQGSKLGTLFSYNEFIDI